MNQIGLHGPICLFFKGDHMVLELNSTLALKDPEEIVVIVDKIFNHVDGVTYILFKNVKDKEEIERRCLTVDEFKERIKEDGK